MMLLRVLVFMVGAFIVMRTIFSAVRTFVLPRSANDGITRIVFLTIRRIFGIFLLRKHTYRERDALMAYYAPIGLLTLLPAWLVLAQAGFTMMYWGLGIDSWTMAFRVSGSSLLTLGTTSVNELVDTIFIFSEATIGLVLLALLIAYLPTMYSAFSQREAMVTLLEVRAGSPPSPVELIERAQRIGLMRGLTDLWENWERWFAEIEESHTSLAALVFFRSPRPEHSWVTAAGTVLDAAALMRSTIDAPRDPHADLCLRAGYVALRHIADYFRIRYNSNPQPGDPISIVRGEFDAVCDRLASKNIPLKTDRDQAWRDFSGWRVNYDSVLLALASLTMAPPDAFWITDEPRRKIRLQYELRP